MPKTYFFSSCMILILGTILIEWQGLYGSYLFLSGVRENSIVKVSQAESYLGNPLKNERLWYHKSLIYARQWEYARAEVIARDILSHTNESRIKKSTYELLWDIRSLEGENEGSGNIRLLAYREWLSNYESSEQIESTMRVKQKITLLKSLISNQEAQMVEAEKVASTPTSSDGSGTTSSPSLSREEAKTLSETRDTLEEYQKAKQKFVRLVWETTEEEALKDLWGSLIPVSWKKLKEDW